MPHQADEVVAALLREGESLGVTGRGALGSFGRLLLSDEAAATERLAELVPDPVDQLLLQADLTAIVPGTPVPELAAMLRRSSVLESRGGASVHRFTEAALRGALDAGWTADDLLESLARFSATPVPQPLDYLVRDVARRHGQLRVGSAGSYLRSDDPTHLGRCSATATSATSSCGRSPRPSSSRRPAPRPCSTRCARSAPRRRSRDPAVS